jgi:predicted metal-dependent hydrolase
VTTPELERPEERELLARGIEEFNRRLFFECHDTLEELWSGLRGPARSFVQGLIQVAVGFHHLGHGNRVGAARLLDRGLERLSAYPPDFAGLDSGALRAELEPWRDALRQGGPLPEFPPPRLVRRGP